ncbi:AAA family ATPase [Shimia sediminis]|uniref:AAA family ATPase n=1 Tax=Shimia sediminis TaxID=2497945 RepID=UPI000F8DA1D5|nr:AAA family ATPase [Shimia sediminis]
MADKKNKSKEHLNQMNEEERSPFAVDEADSTSSEDASWKNDPVWQERIKQWAKGEAHVVNWLSSALSDVSTTGLKQLECLILETVSEDDLRYQMHARIVENSPWVEKEANRIAGNDEIEDIELAMRIKHWIALHADEDEFAEELKHLLTKLPIDDLRRGIIERESANLHEAHEMMRERSLIKDAKHEVSESPAGSNRYVKKDKKQLPTNIRKNISGKLDNVFRELDYARITKEQLEKVTGLKSKFPNASSAIDLLSGTLRRHWQFGDDRIRLRPIILTGEPGTGKTRLCRELAKVLNVPVTEGNVGGHNDSQILGVSGGWSSAFPSIMTTAVADAKLMNPLILIDEIDKVRPSHNGDVWAEFLGLLEPAESSTYYEKFLTTNVDASGICWVFTANDLSLIPRPFLSRCAVCEVHPPQPDQLRTIVSSLVDDYAKSLGVDKRFLPLTAGDVAYLESTWMEHRSIRVLSELIRHIFDENQQQLGTA